MSSHPHQNLDAPSRASRAGARQWLGLATLVLPVLLISIDMTVLSFAVPHLSEALAPSGEQLLWIVDIYGFMLAGLLVTMGSLGDRIGRRRLLLVGAAAFGVASAAAALSPNPEVLIAARAVLGLAGATLMPSTLSLIRHLFPDERQRTVAIAVWGSAFSAGAALGPIVGAVLLEHFYWGSVFLINVPVVALLLVTVPLLVGESRTPTPGGLDPLSVVLSLVGMLAAVFGLKKLAEGEVGVLPIAALAAGVGLVTLFVRRQKRLTDPLIDLELFAVPRFRAGVMGNFLLVFAMVGSLFFLSQLLQLGYGMRPLHASLVLVPGLIISVVASFIVIPIARRTSLRTAIVGGILINAAGFVVLALVPTADGAVVALCAFALLGLGSGLAETMTNDAILTAAPPDRAGAASAISETAYELGGALGVAVLGSVLSAGYTAHLGDVEGLGGPMPEAATQTLGGAVSAAEQMGGSAGEALLTAARAAFIDGVHLTSAIAAVFVLAAAVLVGAQLRRR